MRWRASGTATLLSVTRATGKVDVKVPQPRFALLLATHEPTARRWLDGAVTTKGVAARALVIGSPDADRDVSAERRPSVRDFYNRLTAMLRTADGRRRVELQLTKGATKAWKEARVEEEADRAVLPDSEASLMYRRVQNATRIAATLAVVDGQETVTVDALRAGLTLARWGEAERARLAVGGDVSDPVAEANRVAEWLATTGSKNLRPVDDRWHITRRDLQRGAHVRTAQATDEVLEELEAAGGVCLTHGEDTVSVSPELRGAPDG